MNKNILVLGGAGYIGSVIVEKLQDLGHNIVIYDNLSTGHKIPKNITFINGDIKDGSLLNMVMAFYKIDVVIHLCALNIVPDSMSNPGIYFQNNVAYGINILEAMKNNGVKKIIFSSTASVYGEPKKIPIEEIDNTLPTNIYGETKLMFEKIIQWYNKIYGIKYVIFRYFNVGGATLENGESHNPETHIIPTVINASINNSIVKIFGNKYNTPDGTCIRDYIHVLDIANAHVLSLDEVEGIYNLGSGKGYSVKDIISTTELIIGEKLKYEYMNNRTGDPPILVTSYKLFNKTTGWFPELSLKDIIKSQLEYKLGGKNDRYINLRTNAR